MINYDYFKLPVDVTQEMVDDPDLPKATEVAISHKRLTTTQEVDGLTWVGGKGNKTNGIMIIGLNPNMQGVNYKIPITGAWFEAVREAVEATGMRTDDIYITNAVKHATVSGRNPTGKMLKACLPVLLDEINRLKPRAIVTIHGEVFKTLTGTDKRGGSTYVGAYATPRSLGGIRLYPAPNPATFKQDLNKQIFNSTFANAIHFVKTGEDPVGSKVEQTIITSKEQFAQYLLTVELARISRGDAAHFLAIDTESEGDHWFHSYGYMRSLQITDSDENTAVLKFFPSSLDEPTTKRLEVKGVGDDKMRDPPTRTTATESTVDQNVHYEGCIWIRDAMAMLRAYLEMKRTFIIGHNIKFDGLWVYKYGLDLRKYIKYDTMLAEHALCNLGPFSLTMLTLKYTNLGKYDMAVDEWKAEEGLYHPGDLENLKLTPYTGENRADLEFQLKCVKDNLMPLKRIADRATKANEIMDWLEAVYPIALEERIVIDDELKLGAIIPQVRGWIKDAIAEQHPKPVKLNNKRRVDRGYGSIPDDILLAYGGSDVVATMRIMKCQCASTDKDVAEAFKRITKKRGHDKEYVSLLEATVNLSCDLWELELVGMPIDLIRMEELTTLYHGKMQELLKKLGEQTTAMGWKSFSPGSSIDKKQLLFGIAVDVDGAGVPIPKPKLHHGVGLGLTPLTSSKGSGGKPWSWVVGQSAYIQSMYPPSMDADVVKALSRKCDHPVLQTFADYSKLTSMCTTFLRAPDENTEDFISPEEFEEHGKGWNGFMCRDSRLRPVFGQLTDTGRLSSRAPNAQNSPKNAENAIAALFPKDQRPPSIRTIQCAPKGWKIIEADYSQAELFVLSHVSGDTNMIKLLTTPGKDMHSETAISAFKLKVRDKEGKEINEEYAVALATKDIDAFEAWQAESWTYETQGGEILSHGKFKKTSRASAKSVNFG